MSIDIPTKKGLMMPRKKAEPKVVLPEKNSAAMNSLVPPSLKKDVENWAIRNGMTVSAAVRYMCNHYLDSVKGN